MLEFVLDNTPVVSPMLKYWDPVPLMLHLNCCVLLEVLALPFTPVKVVITPVNVWLTVWFDVVNTGAALDKEPLKLIIAGTVGVVAKLVIVAWRVKFLKEASFKNTKVSFNLTL